MSDLQLLTCGEAARQARVSPSPFGKMIRSDRGPTVTRIGRKVFVRPEHLVVWIDRCAEQREPDPATLFPAAEADKGNTTSILEGSSNDR